MSPRVAMSTTSRYSRPAGTRTRSVTTHPSRRQPGPTSTSSQRIERVTVADGSTVTRLPTVSPAGVPSESANDVAT